MEKVMIDFNNATTTCEKCGFKPVYNEKWKLSYVEKCHNTYNCGWEDKEVDEHLHVKCPTCGFELSAPCDDYKAQKGNQWSTTEPVADAVAETVTPTINQTPVYTPPLRGRDGRFVSPAEQLAGNGFQTQPARVATPPAGTWDTECHDCPCSEKKTG